MARIRGRLLWLFGALLAVGLLVAALGNLGGMMILAATGGVYVALEKRGLEADAALVGELYGIVLTMDRPWSWVLLSGVVAIFLSLMGFAAVWRAR
ncbi:MAG: hypothetical protein OEM24_10160 [Paracoccaceae bacterium]|nr:hypothetical protein [Paracoccaceae bacterium]